MKTKRFNKYELFVKRNQSYPNQTLTFALQNYYETLVLQLQKKKKTSLKLQGARIL